VSVIGFLVGCGLLIVVPQQTVRPSVDEKTTIGGHDGRGFGILLAIGSFDTATRMGYLLFLPFLLHAKGGHQSAVGIGLALVFIGGALGKALCGWLGQRLGVVWSVIVTEAATACFIIATLMLPFVPTLVVLPLLGIVLNGTSSVLYGTVPELAKKGEVGRAFALFYTGVIGTGGLAPIAYGILADHSSRTIGVVAAAMTAAVIIPMVFALSPHLQKQAAAPAERTVGKRRDRHSIRKLQLSRGKGN
jgi:MFS transporter, FSR family, fosmidomycin resistance protein